MASPFKKLFSQSPTFIKAIFLLSIYISVIIIAIIINDIIISNKIPKQQNITPLILSLEGTKLSTREKKLYSKINPFGFILFQYNLQDDVQAQNLITEIRNLFPNRKTYLFIDHEGGYVNRLHKITPAIKSISAAEYGKIIDNQNLKEAKKLLYKNVFQETALLKEIGIDVNLAPVVDLQYYNKLGSSSSITSDYHAYHHKSSMVTELANEFIKATHDNNIYAALKHIPGLSESFGDTHNKLVTVNKNLSNLRKTDFLPFSKLSPKVKFAMVNHIIYSAIDDKPASLSKKTINLIRNEIGFKGLLIADAFNMKALQQYSMKEKVQLSLKAGIDIIIPLNFSPHIIDKLMASIDQASIIKFNKKLKKMNL